MVIILPDIKHNNKLVYAPAVLGRFLFARSSQRFTAPQQKRYILKERYLMTCKYCGNETPDGWIEGEKMDICVKCQKIQNDSHEVKASNKSMGNMRTEMSPCVCSKCKELTHEILIYPEKPSNHAFHVIASISTFGIWLIVWFLIWVSSNKSNESAKRYAVLSQKCKKCGSPMMLLT